MKIIFICLYLQGLVNSNTSANIDFGYIQIECEIQVDIINRSPTCLLWISEFFWVFMFMSVSKCHVFWYKFFPMCFIFASS